MRAKLTCLWVLVIAGCTRLNPAFEGGGDETVDATSQSTQPNETGESGGESGLPLCPLDGGTPLDIKMALSCSDSLYDRWFLVNGFTDDHTWQLAGCSDDCSVADPICDPSVPLTMRFSPLPLMDLASTGTCLHVIARRSPDAATDDCAFGTAVVWEVTNSQHSIVLIARNASDVALPNTDDMANPRTPHLSVMLNPIADCPCDDYDMACCPDESIPPEVYEFDVGLGMPLQIGDVAPVDVEGMTMDFWGLNAFRTGECGATLPDVSWALTRRTAG